ncbi:MAG: dihydroxyacetone kinase subunit DhaL [Anaerostipes sp.]|nr:dihydroxyacetone kinase subunit DhaL [Anaerostipes sp.]
MASFENTKGSVIVDALIKVIQSNRDYLSEIDGKIGDGDHGINMNKGFTMCEKKLEGKEYDMSQGLSVLGETLLEDIGGSMGPLYGLLFDEMAEASDGQEVIDVDVFAEMMNGAVEGIQEISPAKVGDKTLLDTLIPATNAFVDGKDAGKEFAECLEDMCKAAEKGWKSTEDMVAKLGRASRLGERSRGVLDAGATSCYLIVSTIGKTAKDLLA